MDSHSVILVTGCAGFIGYHLSKRLMDEGCHVVGLDNLNDYYDQSLKIDRLNLLKTDSLFTFYKGSLENLELLELLFDRHTFDCVVNLAAQAGVRYSLDHPHTYIQSNLVGFANLLECCRNYKIKHLLYASSSSVYGDNTDTPYSERDRVDHPISLYAATKKANEEMAYTYSHLYNLPTTGMRFFTVYGPWGRPDMAPFKFSHAITNNESIDIYNYGNMKRDFTYVDDVCEAITRLIKIGPPVSESSVPYKVFNIGNHQPVQLKKFVRLLELEFGAEAKKKYLPIHPGDVPETFADTSELEKAIDYKPSTSIEDGVKKFAAWYRAYYDKASS